MPKIEGGTPNFKKKSGKNRDLIAKMTQKKIAGRAGRGWKSDGTAINISKRYGSRW